MRILLGLSFRAGVDASYDDDACTGASERRRRRFE